MKSNSKFTLYIFLVCLAGKGLAQIPNAGFESWTSMGSYSNPDGWDNLNSMCNTTSGYCAEQGTPGNPGSYYLKLTSRSVLHMGTMPGMAVSGVMDPMTMKPKSGIPFTSQPVSLSGSWQYMSGGGSDAGYISVCLSKWNTGLNRRDTISYTKQILSGMMMSWTPFSFNLSYQSGATPDSAILVFSASGPVPAVNSYLYIDNLAFSGTATGIQEANWNPTLSIFPNPAQTSLNVGLDKSNTLVETIEVFDMQGKLVLYQSVSSNTPGLSLEISGLNQGEYMLKLTSKEGYTIRKFQKN